MKRTDPLNPLCQLCPHAGDTEWVIRNVETGNIYPCCSQCFRAFALRLAQEAELPPMSMAHSKDCNTPVGCACYTPGCIGEEPRPSKSPCAQAREGRLPEPDGFEI